MNIALNALSARAGAGISVFQNLMPALAKIDKKNNYFIFVSEDQKDIINFIPSKFNKIILNKIPKNPYLRVLWEQLIMPIYLKKFKIDLLYSVGNTTVLLAPCKVLLFIENTNPFSKVITNWSFKEKIRNKFLFILSKLSSYKAYKIRFCSERSRDIVCKMLQIPLDKTFILHHGINFEKFNIDNCYSPFSFQYILGLSVVAPHKNFEVLIKAFALIKRNLKYSGKLVIVGDTCYKKYFNKLTNLINKLSLDNDVIFTRKIQNSEVYKYYRFADMFVFPSLEETFGIPLIEALAIGVPTLASDGTLHKDLFIPFNELSEHAIFFNPFDENDLAEKIKYVLQSPSIKEYFKNNRICYLEKYDINIVARELVKEFNSIGDDL